MSEGVIIGVGPTAAHLKALLVAMDYAAEMLDLSEVVVHEVDCQLYGSLFRNHCNDPLLEIYEAISVPSEYRHYISKTLYESVEILLDRAIGPPRYGWSHVVDWVSPSAGVIYAWPEDNSGAYNTPPSVGVPQWNAA